MKLGQVVFCVHVLNKQEKQTKDGVARGGRESGRGAGEEEKASKKN